MHVVLNSVDEVHAFVGSEFIGVFCRDEYNIRMKKCFHGRYANHSIIMAMGTGFNFNIT